MRSRRPSTVLIAVVALTTMSSLTGCRPSARETARAEFIEQLTTEGGVPAELAECVADGFLDTRTTEEMKAFFERPELTSAEADEFARLAEDCGVVAQP